MNSVKTHCHIFGPTSWYGVFMDAHEIMIEKYENYQKKSTRNRYSILSTHGIQVLSIPLTKGKNEQQCITDVQISYDEDWTKNHLNAIRSAYGKSPYFEFYYPQIEKSLRHKYKFLFDLNVETMNLTLQLLGLNQKISFTSSYSNTQSPIKLSNVEIIKYPQVWQEKHNFVPNLSIIDLLFCMGPESLSILKKMNLNQKIIAP